MSHVFISYSHEDADFVAKLIEYCQFEGIDVWYDDGLNAGESWTAQIDEAITNAPAIILIISPSSSVSPYVTYEWAFAKGLGKKIIPVICETINDNHQLQTDIDTIKQEHGVKLPKPQVHPDFTIVNHHIELSGRNNTPQNWKKLINQIRGVLDNFLLTNLSPDAPVEVKNAYANLKSPDGSERKNAVESLSHNESPYAEDALILGLDSSYPAVRYGSAKVLGQKRSKKAIPKLIYLVEDSNDDVRRFTIIALIRIGGDEVVPGLIKVLKDKDREIVKKAIKALGDIGHPSAVNYLIQIEDNDYQVLQTLYQALGQIGSEQAMPYLIEQLDKNPHFTAIIKSLGEIGGIDGIPHLIKRLEYAANHTRQAVFEALVNIGEKAVPYLIEGLQHQHQDVRNEITEILVQIGDKAVPNLIQALQHKNGYVRRCVVKILSRSNTPEAQEALKRIRS